MCSERSKVADRKVHREGEHKTVTTEVTSIFYYEIAAAPASSLLFLAMCPVPGIHGRADKPAYYDSVPLPLSCSCGMTLIYNCTLYPMIYKM